MLWLLPIAALLVLAGCADEPDAVAPTPVPAAIDAATSATAPPPTALLPPTVTATLPPTPTLVPPTATPETTMATFAETDCPFHRGGRAITCGYVVVPENRNDESGQEIRLFLAIAHSTSQSPEPDPIVFLHGGPGGQAGWYTPAIAVNFSAALEHRDLIVFDQRGAGLSEPLLDCPEVEQALYGVHGQLVVPEVWRETVEAGHRACYERLASAGTDFTRYNSAESAADINDLRLALGYDEVNLFGVSYGTRLALTTMRDYPHMVRSVILDSMVPLEVDMYATRHVNRERAFELVFSHCAADAQCADAFPQLEERFYRLVERLDSQPITLQVRNPADSQLYDVVVDGDMLITVFFWTLYSSEAIPNLPRYVSRLERGLTTDLRELVSSYAFLSEAFSEGASAAVWCYDEMGFSAQVPVTDTLHPRQQKYAAFDHAAQVDQCAVWKVGAGPEKENEPVRSAIPALILAGEFDPITPPLWGQQVAGTLDNAYYFEFPSASHGVLSARDCARAMVAAFVSAPSQEPALECYSQLQDTTFIIR